MDYAGVLIFKCPNKQVSLYIATACVNSPAVYIILYAFKIAGSICKHVTSYSYHNITIYGNAKYTVASHALIVRHSRRTMATTRWNAGVVFFWFVLRIWSLHNLEWGLTPIPAQVPVRQITLA